MTLKEITKKYGTEMTKAAVVEHLTISLNSTVIAGFEKKENGVLGMVQDCTKEISIAATEETEEFLKIALKTIKKEVTENV